MALAGRYLAKGEVMGTDMDCDCNFTVEGNVLTGTMVTMGNKVDILDGEADGDHFKCKCKVPSPMGKMKIKIEGDVNGDDIEFILRNPMGKAKFVGKRV